MSTGSSKPKQQVTAYYASVHYGICTGPVDEVLEVWYGEKLLVAGNITVNSEVFVDEPELFGGVKVEGGFVGFINFLLGGSSQVVPDALGTSLQYNEASTTADPAQLPGYRGVFSMFIHGGEFF